MAWHSNVHYFIRLHLVGQFIAVVKLMPGKFPYMVPQLLVTGSAGMDREVMIKGPMEGRLITNSPCSRSRALRKDWGKDWASQGTWACEPVPGKHSQFFIYTRGTTQPRGSQKWDTSCRDASHPRRKKSLTSSSSPPLLPQAPQLPISCQSSVPGQRTRQSHSHCTSTRMDLMAGTPTPFSALQ